MKTPLRFGSLVGIGIGVLLVIVIGTVGFLKASAGFRGDGEMWFLAYMSLAGMPLTLFLDSLIQTFDASIGVYPVYEILLILIVILNWSLVGLLVGTTIAWVRRREV